MVNIPLVASLGSQCLFHFCIDLEFAFSSPQSRVVFMQMYIHAWMCACVHVDCAYRPRMGMQIIHRLHPCLLSVLFMVVDPQDVWVKGSSGKAANHGEIWRVPLVGRQAGHVFSAAVVGLCSISVWLESDCWKDPYSLFSLVGPKKMSQFPKTSSFTKRWLQSWVSCCNLSTSVLFVRAVYQAQLVAN